MSRSWLNTSINTFSMAYGKKPKQFLPEAIDDLQAYLWPGNVH